mgnify:CR=1 FL=1
MKTTYKKYPNEEFYTHRLNTLALNEVLTGDDSVFFHELEVYLENKKEWKCLQKSFKDKDVITDNYNTIFKEAKTEEEKAKGYFE